MTNRRLATLLLLVFDCVCVVAVFMLIGWLRGVHPPAAADLPSLLGPCATLVLAVYLIDGYSTHTDMARLAFTSQYVIALAAGMLATLLLTFVFIKDQFSLQASRAVIVLSFASLVPLTLSYRRWLTLKITSRRLKRTILFVGSQAGCAAFHDACEKNFPRLETLFVATDGACTASLSPLPGVEMLSADQLPSLLDRFAWKIEAIVLHDASRDLPFAVTEKLMELHFSGTRVYTVERFHEAYWRKIPLGRLDQMWLFQEGFELTRDPVYERLKRLSDIVLSLLGLIFALPLLVACAAAVWLDDRGPVLFAQLRIGRNRVPFLLLKFRTMTPDTGNGALYTQADDPRITRVGRLLRAMRLDELPQLWNVLRGDMSLIGPRAEWSKLVERYEREIPCYHFRHLVKPGITGWAQVNYPYGASLEDTLRKLEYDLYYVRYFSFVLDASIVLKTIHIMLGGKGR